MSPLRFSLTTQNCLRYYLKQIVNEVNKSNLAIYSYTGNEKHEPIYYEEITLFKQTLAKVGLSCPIIEVSNSEFSPLKWNPKRSILHIPGAVSSELDVHLGSKVNEIKEFVNKGGKFIGWCGGGYWACREVQYRINDCVTLHKIRNLSFWKGIEKGPLLPFLGNPEGNIGFFHGAVKLKWFGSDTLKGYLPSGLEFNALLSGGGFFIPHEKEHPHKVLAVYEGNEKNKPYAVVKTYIGDGIAILVNPYFTHGAQYLRAGLKAYEKHFPEHSWSKIILDLEKSELENRLCFADMLLEGTRNCY